MILWACAVCWSIVPPGPIEAEVKARIEALPVGQGTIEDLAWPDHVLDALVDRIIGQSWRTSTQHPLRQSRGLGPEQTSESSDPWSSQERASRSTWANAGRPPHANFFGNDLPPEGTAEQALVVRQLSTEGLVSTLFTHCKESTNVDRLLDLGVPIDVASLLTGPEGAPERQAPPSPARWRACRPQ